MMIKIADQNGGLVAGMPLDTAAANAALTNVSDARTAAAASRAIAQKMDDDAVQQRVVVADRVFAIYKAAQSPREHAGGELSSGRTRKWRL